MANALTVFFKSLEILTVKITNEDLFSSSTEGCDCLTGLVISGDSGLSKSRRYYQSRCVLFAEACRFFF